MCRPFQDRASCSPHFLALPPSVATPDMRRGPTDRRESESSRGGMSRVIAHAKRNCVRDEDQMAWQFDAD